MLPQEVHSNPTMETIRIEPPRGWAFLGLLAKLPTNDIPYPLFVFCGLLPWTFFASAITNAGNSVVGSEKLVTKVYFPRLIIPLAAIGSSLIDLLVASLILIGLHAWFHATMSLYLLLAPLCLLLIAGSAIGIGAILASLNVAYRDFRIVLPFLIQLWLFATPSIFMDIHAWEAHPEPGFVSSWLPWLLALNPMVPLIATFRDCVLGHTPNLVSCLPAAILSIFFLVAGCSYFRWVEHQFADII